MRETDPIVFVLDDEPAVREALTSLIRRVGVARRDLRVGAESPHRQRPDVPSCLVLDVRPPGMSGLALQCELSKSEITPSGGTVGKSHPRCGRSP